MSLHDRAADKQPDPHAAGFCRVEGIEERVHALCGEADGGITDRQANTIAVLPFGSDPAIVAC